MPLSFLAGERVDPAADHFGVNHPLHWKKSLRSPLKVHQGQWNASIQKDVVVTIH